MQPCGLSFSDPDYISYTALLLLQSSALLAKVSTTAGMDSRRPQWHQYQPTQTHHQPSNPPACERIYRNIRAVVDSPSPQTSPFPDPAKTKKKHGSNLKNLLRRKEGESSRSASSTLTTSTTSSTATLHSPYMHPEPSRSAPPMQAAYPGCLPPDHPFSDAYAVRYPHPTPLLVPPAFGRPLGPQQEGRSPQDARLSDDAAPYTEQPVNPASSSSSSSAAAAAAIGPVSPVSATRRRQSETFNASELQGFAEATSGFDPFSPVRQRPVTEYYAPPRLSAYARSQTLPSPSLAQSLPSSSCPLQQWPQYHAPEQDGLEPGTADYDAVAVAVAAGGEDVVGGVVVVDDGAEYAPPPLDELPDYAQSQWEAHSRRRREAARRAAELERQWLEARRARGL